MQSAIIAICTMLGVSGAQCANFQNTDICVEAVEQYKTTGILRNQIARCFPTIEPNCTRMGDGGGFGNEKYSEVIIAYAMVTNWHAISKHKSASSVGDLCVCDAIGDWVSHNASNLNRKIANVLARDYGEKCVF